MKNIRTTISFYCKKLRDLFERFLNKLAVGIVFGFVLGIVLFLIIQKNVSSAVIFISAAFAGVFAEIFVRLVESAINLKRQLTPLKRTLGSIATDDTWIYISAWRRDLDDLDHTILYRNDPDQQAQPMIVGSEYVYGKGDAIALSYIYETIEKATRGETQVYVEDSERAHDKWNRSAVCIGAHNSKTREILDKFDNTYYRFYEDYSLIIESDAKISNNGSSIPIIDAIKQLRAQDSSDIDFGVVLKLKDKYYPDKDILVVAGLGDDGTAGAAYYLLNHFEDLPYEDETFGVIIKVPSGPQSAQKVEFGDVARSTVVGVSRKNANE
jgi:hypothetical protein